MLIYFNFDKLLLMYGYRHCNGKVYELYDEYQTEQEALEDRDILKRNGFNVRIVKRKSGCMRFATYVNMEPMPYYEMPA